MLDKVISNGIIEKKERKPGQTSTIIFYLKDRIIQYSLTETREERIIEKEKTEPCVSYYFG